MSSADVIDRNANNTNANSSSDETPRAEPTPNVPVLELFSLTGKTAIVTGGTGGLGLSMTLALAGAGADIVSIEIPNDPNSHKLSSEVQNTGRKLTQYQCDVASSKSLRETFTKIWSDGHDASILLNCAGIQRRGAAIVLHIRVSNGGDGPTLRWGEHGLALINASASSF